MVVVALPQGMSTSWVYDAAAVTAQHAAAAAAAAATAAASARKGRRRGQSCKGKGHAAAGTTGRTQGSMHSGVDSSERGWFECPYAAAWQFRKELSTLPAYFMATSWAALWPVFLRAAVPYSSSMDQQVSRDRVPVVRTWQRFCQVAAQA
jgi:hypothetical protein